MASPRDLTGVLRWWSADAPAEIDGGRVAASADVVAGAVAARYGQGRVGPELVLVDGKPVWRFGGAASPASLLTPGMPSIPGSGYTWFFVLTPTAGYAGQAIAPGPNTAVTSSSSQLLAETTGSFRWSAFAGASTTLPMPSGEQLIVVDHDGGTGATRLYITGSGSSRATLQRRSLAGQQHIGRHGSQDRPLSADVKAIGLVDHSLTDAEIALLEQWRAEGASSAVATAPVIRAALARSTTRSRTSARPLKQRPAPARTTTRSTSAARDAAMRRATARATERTLGTAVPRATRPVAAPAATETAARARSAARKAVPASATTLSAGEALSGALSTAAARVRTLVRTAGTAAADRVALARAVTRTLGTALHRRPRPATDRDVEVTVGEPAPGFTVGAATTAWSVSEPTAAWTIGPPTLDAR